MADLEQLAQALGGDPFYQTVASEWSNDIQKNPWLKTSQWVGSQENPFNFENPYLNESYAERTDRFHKYYKSAKDRGWDDAKATDYATKAIKSEISKKPSWEKSLIFNLAQSLGGGFTYGLGKKQAEKDLLKDLNELGNTYSQSIAGQYGRKPEQFNYDSVVSAKAALDQMREREKLNSAILPSIIEKNPQLAKAYYAQNFGGMGGAGGMDGGFYGSPSLGGQQSQGTFNNSVQSIDDKIEAYAQSLINEGVTPNTAYERASQRFKSLLGQEDRGTKKIEDLTKSTQSVDALINSANSYIEGAGDTGGKGGVGAGIQNLAASIFQPDKAVATRNLDSLGAQFMGMNRVAGTGAVSDFEAKMYLRAGVSSANEPETNREVLRRLGYLNELDKQYADFLDTYKGEKGTLEGADSIWRKYVQSNPALIKDKQGNFVENANRPDWKTWISGAKQDQAKAYEDSVNPAVVDVNPADVDRRSKAKQMMQEMITQGVPKEEIKRILQVNGLIPYQNEKKNSDNAINAAISDDLLDAIARAETGGISDPNSAVSPKGAKGQYQFMDATAKSYGVDPSDPVSSRKGARQYLLDELSALGSIPLAVAAYNAGRPKVLEAIEKAGSRNLEDILPHLPQETQLYVYKVLLGDNQNG